MGRSIVFCFQAEDGIRDLVRSRGLGDVYKRQGPVRTTPAAARATSVAEATAMPMSAWRRASASFTCLLYTSDAADERSSVDLGGRRIIKKKTQVTLDGRLMLRNASRTAVQRATIEHK